MIGASSDDDDARPGHHSLGHFEALALGGLHDSAISKDSNSTQVNVSPHVTRQTALVLDRDHKPDLS
jgi:hypothetical protein